MAHRDSEALERKLRPIYDALDARNWKAALKLADAALKKYKQNQLLRSLKSFALAKSGKQAEALQLCADLVREGPEDELVLNTMAYTYKATGRHADITAAHLAAVERSPANPELLCGLFAAYVREFNFVKQQQTAVRLIKAAAAGAKEPKKQPQQQGGGGGEGEGESGPPPNYALWAVSSLVLQARAALLGGPASLPADKLLQLAESMATRPAAGACGAGGAPATFEELLLLLDILHGQGKHAQALEVLDGAGKGVVPMEADRLHLRAAALARAGDLAAAAELYRGLALASPDDWAAWALFLDCLLPATAAEGAGTRFPVGVVGGLAELWDRRHPWRWQQQRWQEQGGAAPDAQAAWRAAEAALAELQQAVQARAEWLEQAERGVLRGATLAPLELALRRLRLARRGDAPAEAEAAAERAVVEQVLAAFRRTAGNSSCAADLRGGLQALAAPELRAWLAGEIRAAAAEAGASGEGEGEATSANSAAAAANGVASTASQGSAAGAGAEPGSSSGGSSANGSGSSSGPSGKQQEQGGAGAAAEEGGRDRRPPAGELRRFQAWVNAYQVEAELGLPRFGCAAEAEAHAAAVLRCFRARMHLSAALDEKDRGYGEELVCIAAAALLRAAQLEAQAGAPRPAAKRLLQALLVLEAAQVRRRVSAPLRLAATALYGLAGAPRAAAASLAALDVKYILHDTLTGHWLLPVLLAGGAEAAELKKWLGGVGHLHEEHCREAGETLMLAYYGGTYSKVVEFVDFKERLAASHTRALGRAEDAAAALRAAATAVAADKAAAPAPLLLAALEGAGALQDLPAAAGLQALGLEAGGGGAPAEGAESEAEAGAGAAAAVALRFNEDLSTRPAWLPPALGPCRLAVANWWGAFLGGGCTGGYVHCWWAEPGAADAAQGAEGAEWRRRQVAALSQRALLPGLLANALAAAPSGGELAALGQRLRQLAAALGAVGSAAGVPGPSDPAAFSADLSTYLAQRAQQAGSVQAAAPAGLSALVGDTSLALFAAAHALHAALLADPAASPSAAGTAVARLGALQQLMAALCAAAAAGLAAPGDGGAGPLLGVLPLGGGLCLASALLLEEGPWLAACLQAWSKLLRPAGGKKQQGGGSAGEGLTGATAEQLRGVLPALGKAAAEGIGRVQLAVDALLAPTQQQQVRQLAADLDLFGAAAAAAAPAAGGEGGDAPLGTLWAFEPSFKPLEVLQRLVADQRAALERLQGGAKATLSLLAAVQA